MPAARLNLEALAAVNPAELPNGNSPDLELVLANEEEQEQCTLLNFASWAGPLDAATYLRREDHLATAGLAKDGGLSVWILVDKNDHASPRNILAACESIRKRALVASMATKEVKDSTAFGIGSVYCRAEYRGKGYAVRMMTELSRKLQTWQQKTELRNDFTVLYSDIGKKFYARTGWIPYASSHAALPPRRVEDLHQVALLRAGDLPELCRKDEQLLRQRLNDFSGQELDFRLAFIPDIATMSWHHAREEFLASELTGRSPDIKGAMVKSSTGQSVWCIWNRVFAKDQTECVLYILRMVFEDEDLNSSQIDPRNVRHAAACLAAAQYQAAEWNMSSVHVWNPSATVLAACKELQSGLEVIHRDDESIASLNWYGDRPGADSVEWIANEKFGWC